MRPSLTLLLIALSVAAQNNPHRDASLEDLVAASGGRLAVYARNLGTGETLSLNGVGERHLGSLTRVFVGAAALAEARRSGVGLTHTLPYPEAAYRGARGVLRDRHDERFTLSDLVHATVVHDDPAAADLLSAWLGARLQPWVKGLGVGGLRPLASHITRDVFVLKRLDRRFETVPAAVAQRWLHDGDAKAIVPTPFPEDPRRRNDHATQLGDAWRAWYAQRNNAGTLRAFADALVALLRGKALHRDDRDLLSRLLRSVPTVACARDLSLHLVVHGLDSRSRLQAASAALIETSRGTVVVVTHDGLAAGTDAGHLLSVMGRSALRRKAAGAWRVPPDEDIPTDLPSTLRAVELRAPGSVQRRSDFDVGEVAHLFVDVAAREPTVLVVRWTRADGTHHRESRGYEARKFTKDAFALPLGRTGTHAVELAIGGRRVWAGNFQVRD